MNKLNTKVRYGMVTKEMLADLFGLTAEQTDAVLLAVIAVVGSRTWHAGDELMAMIRALSFELNQYARDAQDLTADSTQV